MKRLTHIHRAEVFSSALEIVSGIVGWLGGAWVAVGGC
jgi:hypothetical protein